MPWRRSPRIDSCDDHLDIYHLPPTLWSDRLPGEVSSEAGPRVDRARWHEGLVVPSATSVHRASAERSTSYATSSPHRHRGRTAGAPPTRCVALDDMDYDGIHSSIVYGPGALFGFPTDDPEVKKLTLKAWNDWAAEEFNSHAPGSAERAAGAARHHLGQGRHRRAAPGGVDLGHKGALFRVHDLDLNHIRARVGSRSGPRSRPRWACRSASTSGAAATSSSRPRRRYDGDQQLDHSRPTRRIGARCSSTSPWPPWSSPACWRTTRELKLVLAESGIGWLPWFVARMDGTFEEALQAPSRT